MRGLAGIRCPPLIQSQRNSQVTGVLSDISPSFSFELHAGKGAVSVQGRWETEEGTKGKSKHLMPYLRGPQHGHMGTMEPTNTFPDPCQEVCFK